MKMGFALLYKIVLIGATVIVGTIISLLLSISIAFKLRSKALVLELRAIEYFDGVNFEILFSNCFTYCPPVEPNRLNAII